MKARTLVVVAAILCITGLATIAMANGIDGAFLMSAVAIIGGLAGYEVKALSDKVNKK